MALLDRVFLAIIAVIMLALAVFLSLTVIGSELVVHWLSSPNIAFEGSILAVIFLLLATYLVILITRGEAKKFIVYPGEMGSVKISADCVESLVVKAARQTSGLQDVKAVISDVENPKVTLKIQVYPDYNIPELSEELQVNVGNYVEKTLGITIEEIEIVVVGISGKSDADLEAVV